MLLYFCTIDSVLDGGRCYLNPSGIEDLCVQVMQCVAVRNESCASQRPGISNWRCFQETLLVSAVGNFLA